MPYSPLRAIAKLDEQILDLQLLLQRQLDAERAEGKHLLLLSRGIQYRIDSLMKKRANLRSHYRAAPTKAATFAIAKAQKEKELEQVQSELDNMYVSLAALNAKSVLTIEQQQHKQQDMREQMADINGQRTRVRNKERALENLLMKHGRTNAAREEIQEPEPTAVISAPVVTPVEVEHRALRLEDTALAHSENFYKSKVDHSGLDLILNPQNDPNSPNFRVAIPASFDPMKDLAAYATAPASESSTRAEITWGEDSYTPPPQATRIII